MNVAAGIQHKMADDGSATPSWQQGWFSELLRRECVNNGEQILMSGRTTLYAGIQLSCIKWARHAPTVLDRFQNALARFTKGALDAAQQ